MADMMAKALEEQAAMQAEMDRQMASLDVSFLPAPVACVGGNGPFL
jgi:hypothetical protein